MVQIDELKSNKSSQAVMGVYLRVLEVPLE